LSGGRRAGRNVKRHTKIARAPANISAGYILPHAGEKRIHAVTDDIGGFEVQLRRSGRTVAIPAGKTILRTLIEAGVDVDYSCAMGGCGTCETRVMEGIPDHRDLYLSDEEKSCNKTIMICCSGSKTPVLALDL
jgi:ferredoxin